MPFFASSCLESQFQIKTITSKKSKINCLFKLYLFKLYFNYYLIHLYSFLLFVTPLNTNVTQHRAKDALFDGNYAQKNHFIFFKGVVEPSNSGKMLRLVIKDDLQRYSLKFSKRGMLKILERGLKGWGRVESISFLLGYHRVL